jgi:hypothetical protein
VQQCTEENEEDNVERQGSNPEGMRRSGTRLALGISNSRKDNWDLHEIARQGSLMRSYVEWHPFSM